MKRLLILSLLLVGCGESGWVEPLLEELVVVAPTVPVYTPTEVPVTTPEPTQTPPTPPEEAETVFIYRVTESDSLWNLSLLLYGDAERWRELYEANGWIVDPHYIYTGDILIVPNFDCEKSQVAECYEE